MYHRLFSHQSRVLIHNGIDPVFRQPAGRALREIVHHDKRALFRCDASGGGNDAFAASADAIDAPQVWVMIQQALCYILQAPVVFAALNRCKEFSARGSGAT